MVPGSMETTSALTKNMFKSQTQNAPKITNLDSQITQLNSDYEDMKQTREEAKQALQARFNEVYEKINQTKTFIVQESVKTNNHQLSFQLQFETGIQKIEQEQGDCHNKFVTKTDKALDVLRKGLETLDKNIEEEKQDRIRSEKQNLDDIQQKLDTLTKNFELEKTTRIENELKVLDKIKQGWRTLETSIKTEEIECKSRVSEFEQHVKHELESQDRFLDTFIKKTINEFDHQTEHVQKEMDNRFDHQNLTVDDIRGVITTIQETLKILGKE